MSQEEAENRESLPLKIPAQASFKKCGNFPNRANISTAQLELSNLNGGASEKRTDLDEMGEACPGLATSRDAAHGIHGIGLAGYKRRLTNEPSCSKQNCLDTARKRLLESLRNYDNMLNELCERDVKLCAQRFQDQRACESGDNLNTVKSLANQLVQAIQNPSSPILVPAESNILPRYSPPEDALASTGRDRSSGSGATQILVGNLTEDDIREGYYGINRDSNHDHQSKSSRLIQTSLAHRKKQLSSHREQLQLKRYLTTANLRATDQSDVSRRASNSSIFPNRLRRLSMDSNESKLATYNRISAASTNHTTTISNPPITTGSANLRSNSGADICSSKRSAFSRMRGSSLSPVNRQNCHESLEGHKKSCSGNNDCTSNITRRVQGARSSALFAGDKETLL